MKKFLCYLLMLAIPIMVSSCNNNVNNSSSDGLTSNDSSNDNSSSSSNEEKIFDEEMYYQEEEENPHFHQDVVNLSTSKDEISSVFVSEFYDEILNLTASNTTYGELYFNGSLSDTITKSISITDDAYYMFYGDNKARLVSLANGYALTLPTTTTIKPNLSCPNYRTQYSTKDYTLTISIENSNPYNNWATYHDEWLVRYLKADGTTVGNNNFKNYMTDNGLSYVEEPTISTSFLSGYEVEFFSILIEDNEQIAMPYYNIAIIRKPSSIKAFTLLVMKSKTNMVVDFKNIVSSYHRFNKPYCKGMVGKATEYDLKIPSYLNIETQKYYKKLMEQNYTDWGFFFHSMYKNGANKTKIIQKTSIFESEEQMNYKFDIMPTYSHTGEYSNPTLFPTEVALELAGGNGFNNRPVLQYTLQFTTSNNEGLMGYTPMFDILRGKYDDYFKKLASDIKTYGKPILFRLNNEMNSDWVSYCGQVTLLDPDIFALTWNKMAKIFEDEGVDNVLFIFNPTAVTYPFSSWGEDLCYLPSLKYVQILGLTYYEYNNYANGEDPMSFYDMYKWLYNKNSPQWTKYPAIISEFACGAGGNSEGYKLYRNAQTQAVWVEDLFDCLNNHRNEAFISQIKGAVWFNANDDLGSKIKNLLVLDTVNTKFTIQMFNYGLNQTKQLKNNQ
ncbi:MAG: glycoside hydrolase family 26 protein [Erysipelotrichaceae bacterium]|nr:glycoside hydrolase family 26 protein [Erysipelotrichaceae bacterium]